MHDALDRITRYMAPDEVDALGDVLLRRRFAVGEVVVGDGQPNDVLFVVAEGTFAAGASVGGQALHFNDFVEGASFGELSLLTGAPTAAEVRASSAGLLLCLSRADLEVLARRSPSAELALVRALTEDLADRVRESSTAMSQPGGTRLGRLRGALARLLGGRAP